MVHAEEDPRGFCGTISGKSFLIVVDDYPKWPEVVAMDKTTTDKTVDELRATSLDRESHYKLWRLMGLSSLRLDLKDSWS